MERIHINNLVRVAEIESSPTIYEELENGKLRIVDPAELGISRLATEFPSLSVDNVSLNPRRRKKNSSATFSAKKEPLKTYEKPANEKLNPFAFARFGVAISQSQKPAPF